MKIYYLKDLKLGRTDFDGCLDLSGALISTLPDNLTVGGTLYLTEAQIERLPDNLTVGSYLDLSGTQIKSLPDNLTVGGSLDLSRTQIKSLPEGLTVGGSLYLSGTPISTLPDNLTVGGSLYLSGTQIKSLPDNLTVGSDLDLSGTPISTLPDNLTVGGSLYLSGTLIRSLPDNLTVGGPLYLSDTLIRDTALECKKLKRLHTGDYIHGRYLYADGILTHIKRRRKVGKYILYIGKIKGKNVVSDGVHFAHCDELRDGISDILFKTAADRGADQYKNLTLDSSVQTEDAIAMYRVITGACRAGTQDFVDRLGELKESYTVQEIINLTEGQYGANQFKKFFEQ